MFIIIQDLKQLIHYELDNDSHINYKGIQIYYRNDNYYISLKDGLIFDDGIKIKKLNEDVYHINSKDNYYQINIYVYESSSGINEYYLYENRDLLVAATNKSSLICKDPHLKNNYLFIKDGIIETNFDISVNQSQYNGLALKNGDEIEYLGLKIIYYDDYLYINSFNVINNLKKYDVKRSIVHYSTIDNHHKYYLPDQIYDLKIEPIKEFKKVEDKRNKDIIKNLLPSIIMSLSVSFLSIINYINALNNDQPLLNRLIYIITPITMVLTGIVLPLSIYLFESFRYKKAYKSNKNEYINYLDEYEKKLDEDIKLFIDSNNDHFFNLLNSKDKIFYASKNSNDYLKLSLGKIKYSFDFDYEYYDDNDIDLKIKNIINKTKEIDDYPLFLDLKENKKITIVSKPSMKKYFFDRFLLETAYKHHYDDIYIAIYTKDTNILDYVYNLPHLFRSNKRLIFTDLKSLQELDQNKYVHELILFAYEPININFTNPNIHIIYFSNEKDDLLKDSEAIIEYENNNAYLYKDSKIMFEYLTELVDQKPYYELLGKYSISNKNKNIFRFKDILPIDEIENNYLSIQNGLRADFAYYDDEILSFDIHESKHGPHGLIGGSTGSGKSELIISLLLSLCIRYSPEYLNIVLIDYKGGGIADSLTYNNTLIPHICASVSNLDNNIFERLIVSLRNECLKRQELFKQLSYKSGLSIMNIDDYLANDYERYDLRKISHLLIVVDEFAEMRKDNGEYIKELISISRIGRSLGVHLILATQKPSGNIDEEIWSNSRFKIALKVLEEKDSLDILKDKSAAYLSSPGDFILKVDDSLIRAKAIYSKTDINNNDPYEVSLLDERLNVVKTYKNKKKNLVFENSEYCRKIIDVSYKLNLKPNKIDFMPPEAMYSKNLCKDKCFVLGEANDYINSKNYLLAYNLNDNLLIYSNRRNEINSFLNTLDRFNKKTLVISNKQYINNVISDSLTYDQNEDIIYLFEQLLKKDYELCIVIDDLSCLLSYNDVYSDYLCRLIKRSEHSKFNFICISRSEQLGYKLINSFKNRLMIDIDDISKLSLFYGTKSKYKGNSFYFKDEPICFIPVKIETFIESKSNNEPLIKHIPDSIKSNYKDDNYLIGYDLIDKEVLYLDKHIDIYSFDEERLDLYKQAYGDNVSVYLYDYSMRKKPKGDFMWLGPGIFNQHLFMSSAKTDLQDNEGIYIHGYNKTLIRSIDCV